MIFTSLEERAQGPKVHSIEEEDQKRKKHKKHTFCPFCHFFQNFTKMTFFGPPKIGNLTKIGQNRQVRSRTFWKISKWKKSTFYKDFSSLFSDVKS